MWLENLKELKKKTGMTSKQIAEAEKDAALLMPEYIVTLLLSFDVVLESIPCGDTNYSDYFETATDFSFGSADFSADIQLLASYARSGR